LVQFDDRFRAVLNGAEAEFTPAAGKQLAIGTEEIVKLPLARVDAARALPLVSGLNPAWSGAVAALREQTVVPLLHAGKTELHEAEWNQLKAVLAPFQRWNVSKPQTTVEKLGIPRLREIATADWPKQFRRSSSEMRVSAWPGTRSPRWRSSFGEARPFPAFE